MHCWQRSEAGVRDGKPDCTLVHYPARKSYIFLSTSNAKAVVLSKCLKEHQEEAML
jgi:hypothetical protein